MRCSTCVGTLSAKRELYREVLGEKGEVEERYYISEINMDGKVFPVVASEYIIGDIEGKVKISCYLRTESNEFTKGKLFSFIQIITCKEVDSSLPDVNIASIAGIVMRRKDILPTLKSGKENLPFVIRYTSYDRNRNIAHCIARGANARKLNVISEGDVLSLDGHFKIHKGTIEIGVEKVLQHRPKKG